MSTKIKIDLSHGTIEAEGTEEFVKMIYDDFKAQLTIKPPVTSKKTSKLDKPSVKPSESKSSVSTRKKKGIGRKIIPSIVSDLDLSGAGKEISLRDFYAKYIPSSNFERNLIFTYYLSNKINLSKITLDHIFTFYRDIPNTKAPNALHQSLIDTSKRKGWIDTASTEDIKVTVPGINYLEHDLPKSGN